jgi:hypothetical protein
LIFPFCYEILRWIEKLLSGLFNMLWKLVPFTPAISHCYDDRPLSYGNLFLDA